VSGDERSDGELLAAAGQGDGTAFALLVRRYIRASTLLAAQMLGDADDADDVVQDAFNIVYRNARAFDAARPFGSWLFGIVRRLASNRLARASRRERLLRWWPNESRPAAAPLPDETLIASLEADAAVRAMADLPPMQRACFELVVVRELSIQEVAAMHGIAEPTVRQHVFRARAALREVLSDND
jgi:RNA polymerase sigma-70 factor, ECF subfamily